MVERTELFRRSIGEVTDIVEKEMYTFDDRNRREPDVAPRMHCERRSGRHRARAPAHAGAQGVGDGADVPVRTPPEGPVSSVPPIDVEIFGIAAPSAEAELIVMTRRLWKALGIAGLTLELNSLGSRDIQARLPRPPRRVLFRARVRARRGQPAPDRDESTADSRLEEPLHAALVETRRESSTSMTTMRVSHFDQLLAMLDEAASIAE